jgi:hypothetical protein
LFLSGYCVLDVFEALVVDQFVDLVAGGVRSGVLLGLVLAYTVGEVVGDADVKLLEGAGEDVNVVGVEHWFS